jgi:polysaccharide transporter, PST family
MMMEKTVLEVRESKRFAITPDSLAHSLVLLLSMTIIQRGVGFGRSLLLCRWLPAEELGHWDLTLAFLDLAAPIAVLSIPACFSRYLEYYRQQGQLRTFVKRTAVTIALLLASSIALLYSGSSWFSRIVYGDDNSLSLLGLVLFALPAVIFFNSINELFGGLRMYRVVTMLQFMQSILFAGLALLLVGAWHVGAQSIVAGYGLACALCSAIPLYWLARMWWGLPSPETVPRQSAFWSKLLPFIGSVWICNWLGNFFLVSDRYMILHYAGMDAKTATMTVGQYHSARVVPLLIIQLSAMISTMFIPYLSYDWEAGRRDVVGLRLNLFLKVVGLGLTALAAMILVASPLLFTSVFAGKFSAGESVLSWTLLCAMWYSMFCIVRSYLWCDERVWLVCLAFIAALVINIGASLLLLPRWGLQGAVWAASLANLAILLVTYGLAMWRGLRISLGTWIVSAVPASICLGAGAAAAVLVVVAAVSLTTSLVFTSAEKEEIVTFLGDYLARWQLKSVSLKKIFSHE